MKRKLCALFLCSFLAPVVHAGKTILPDACGDPKIEFDVKTEKGQPAPAAAETGKAQIVFIEDNDTITAGIASAHHHATVRYGVDGTWAGANYADSYFAVEVTPGEHHLCANWQGKQDSGTAAFTAEAGRVYYFRAQADISAVGNGRGAMVGPVFNFSQLTDDDGKYKVKAWKLATSTPKK